PVYLAIANPVDSGVREDQRGREGCVDTRDHLPVVVRLDLLLPAGAAQAGSSLPLLTQSSLSSSGVAISTAAPAPLKGTLATSRVTSTAVPTTVPRQALRGNANRISAVHCRSRMSTSSRFGRYLATSLWQIHRTSPSYKTVTKAVTKTCIHNPFIINKLPYDQVHHVDAFTSAAVYSSKALTMPAGTARDR